MIDYWIVTSLLNPDDHVAVWPIIRMNLHVKWWSKRVDMNTWFVFFETRRKDVLIVLRDVMLPGRFDPVVCDHTTWDVTTDLFGWRLTSYRSEIFMSGQSLITKRCRVFIILLFPKLGSMWLRLMRSISSLKITDTLFWREPNATRPRFSASWRLPLTT